MKLDVVIFGGGGAGLWLLDELRRRGFGVLLFESRELGHGQTIAAQGIIHGGLKYSLSGFLSGSTKAIQRMPELWRSCLEGKREPNLSDTRVRSQHCFMWRTDSVTSRLGMVGARLGLSTVPVKLDENERPPFLVSAPGEVLEIPEQVIDPSSFLQNLAERNSGHTFLVDPAHGIEFVTGPDGAVECIRLELPDSNLSVELRPHTVVFTAGAGNESLRKLSGLKLNAMQRRQLHMVMVRGSLPEVNGHCVDGSKTRATITSNTDSDKRAVWQVGGQVAEEGVNMEIDEVVSHTRRELEAVLPGVDFSKTEWTAYRIDRAEGRTADGSRPEKAQIMQEANIITGWPTKLALIPKLAEDIVAAIQPSSAVAIRDLSELNDWPRPAVAAPPWEIPHHWYPYREIAR